MTKFGVFYFVSFLTVGVYAPWLPPLLEHRGLSPTQLGWGLGLVSLWRALLPPLWGALADRLQHRHHLLAIVTVIAGLTLVPLLVAAPTWAILAALTLYGVFAAPMLPLTEALTLEALGAERTGYGRVRLWGSLGFIVMSTGMGFVVERLGLASVSWALVLPLFVCAALALGLTAPAHTPKHAPRPVVSLRIGPLIPVLLVATLAQLSHGPYYTFFSLKLSEHGATAPIIGSFWASGVVVEIVLLAFAAPLYQKVPGVRLLQLGLGAAVLRWWILAHTDDLVVIGISQVLHAGSYALVHLATIAMVDDAMPAKNRALGQSLLSATAYGIGVGAGCALAGRLVTSWGYAGIYQAASLICVLALAISPLCQRRAYRKGALV